MQISLSGHHVDITPTIKSYVETKLNRLEQHNDRITNVAVILSVDKLRQKDQSTEHVSGGEVYAAAESQDLYAAIDLLADILDRQLIREEERKKDHKHHH